MAFASEVAKEFGRNSLAARERAGISQEELSFRAGLHRTEIGQLERGNRDAKVSTLIELAGALSLPPGDIKQVQKWLGHADPGFTLKTYVHLMDEGIGDAAFLDDAVAVAGTERQGNPRATRGAEKPEDQPSASVSHLAG